MNKVIRERLDIESSAITSITYLLESKELFIDFISRARYVYLEVPHEVYMGLKYADSIGKYFNKHVKNNYDYEICKSNKRALQNKA